MRQRRSVRVGLTGVARSVSLVAAIASWVVIPQALADGSRPDPSVEAIVKAATAYVAAYEDQLTLILADETYTQHVQYSRPVSPATGLARVMNSEMFFAFVPATHAWLALRDVKKVDGHAIPPGPDLRRMLDTMPASEVQTALKTANSRFNLGWTLRNFNEPTLSLLVFDDTWLSGFRFEVKSVERQTGLVTLAFHEEGSRSLIHDLDGAPVKSSGEVTVEEASGRIHRAVITSPLNGVEAELTTVYGANSKLLIWVPQMFRESYVGSVPANDTYGREEVFCEAHYSNYRRFEVRGGIKGGRPF